MHETSFRIFSSPFEVNAEAVPENFQMELINLQSREEIKSKFMNIPLLEFCKLYFPENNFPELYRYDMWKGIIWKYLRL
jgi:hypothetical protein